MLMGGGLSQLGLCDADCCCIPIRQPGVSAGHSGDSSSSLPIQKSTPSCHMLENDSRDLLFTHQHINDTYERTLQSGHGVNKLK